ncbi:tail fiber assembly protein [Halodesulfovibrio spirochaetisodalis]|uniref:tail fiber assembly protein n=1 Tax=Halodesulfovibrio spirochaetisodalis TaxID=1560234 RepID=UPI00082D7B64|nr:tail fiber assembly protein [Halodesulfovibrio spirochaetisodalis]
MLFYDTETRRTLSARQAKWIATAVPLDRNIPDIDSGLQELEQMGVTVEGNLAKIKWKIVTRAEPEFSQELTRRAQEKCKQLLLQCDWTIGNDSPLTEANQQEWRTYRTFLRNINHQEGFPKVIDWGTPPQQVKG